MKIKEFEKVWSKFQNSADPGLLDEAVTAIFNECREASRIAKEAAEKYFADADEKKARVDGKISDLQRQIADNKEQLKIAVTASAVGSGSDDEQDRLAGEISSLKAAITTAEAEVEILQAAHIRGCEKLYQEAHNKNAEMTELKKTVNQLMRPLANCGFAKKFEKLEYRCNQASSRYTSDGYLGYGADMEKLENHYNAEKIAAEREKEVAERAARREERERMSNVQTGHDPHSRSSRGYDSAFYAEYSTEGSTTSNDGDGEQAQNLLLAYANERKLTGTQLDKIRVEADNDQKLENVLIEVKRSLEIKGTTGDDEFDTYIKNLTFEDLKESHKNYVENIEAENLIISYKTAPSASDAKKYSESRVASIKKAQTTNAAVRAGDKNGNSTPPYMSDKTDAELRRYYENEASPEMRDSFLWFMKHGVDVKNSHKAVRANNLKPLIV